MENKLTPLKVFGTGQVTLPKRLRDKYDAEYYIAEETEIGILLRPLTKAFFYQKAIDDFGLKFPGGMAASAVSKKLKQANASLSKVPAKITKKAKR
jgi:hypothetical protein